MQKTFLLIASLTAGLGVVLGAFGAHGLKKIAPDSVPAFQTGVQYQMYHAFALFIVGILYERFTNSQLLASGWLFLGGILLFSGSLYALAAIKATNTVGLNGIGIITPIGGMLFIAGWIFLVLGLFRK